MADPWLHVVGIGEDGLSPARRAVVDAAEVINAVTLESEALLLALYAQHGRDLVKIAVNRVDVIGRLHGWQPLTPVTQWALVKR